MKAKKYIPSVSPHISVVLKLCTGEIDDVSERDMEPFMEYDEDLLVKPAAEYHPVQQKCVEELAPDTQLDAPEAYASPPDVTCVLAETGGQKRGGAASARAARP